jgi:hypothetical protein
MRIQLSIYTLLRFDPGVNFCGNREHAALLSALRSPHRESQFLFPPLHGTNALPDIASNIFPACQDGRDASVVFRSYKTEICAHRSLGAV